MLSGHTSVRATMPGQGRKEGQRKKGRKEGSEGRKLFFVQINSYVPYFQTHTMRSGPIYHEILKSNQGDFSGGFFL